MHAGATVQPQPSTVQRRDPRNLSLSFQNFWIPVYTLNPKYCLHVLYISIHFHTLYIATFCVHVLYSAREGRGQSSHGAVGGHNQRSTQIELIDPISPLRRPGTRLVAQPLPCMQRFGEVLKMHIVGFQTIPNAGIKWV